MVLTDTSIWIRSLAGRAPYAGELDRLLSLDEVAGHKMVYGELLIGDTGGRKKLLAAYERGAGWIDVHLLASALVSKMTLWTADPRLAALAEELGIGYSG